MASGKACHHVSTVLNCVARCAATIRTRGFFFSGADREADKKMAIRLEPMLTLSSPTLVTCSEVLLVDEAKTCVFYRNKSETFHRNAYLGV